MRRIIMSWGRALTDPARAFSELHRRKFEDMLHEYLLLLILVAIAAGAYLFLTSLGLAMYFDLRYTVDVQYWRLLNYVGGGLMAIVFFYFFAGTFLLFIISLLVRPFARKLKYTEMLKVLFLALSPVLLLGWFLPAIAGLLAWSLFLIISGLAHYHHRERAGTIGERE